MEQNVIEYNGYYATLNFSVEDGVLYGDIEGLSDIVTFEFETIKEAPEKFKEALDDYFDLCKEIGKEPEKQYKGSFNVRISPELHRKLAKYAQRNNMSLNNVVERALASFISPKNSMWSEDVARDQNQLWTNIISISKYREVACQ